MKIKGKDIDRLEDEMEEWSELIKKGVKKKKIVPRLLQNPEKNSFK